VTWSNRLFACITMFMCCYCSVPVRKVELNVSDGHKVTIGDVIYCSADTVYPPVGYYWQRQVNESWQQVLQDDDDYSSGSVLTLSATGLYVLRCVAYNVIGNTTFIVTSDGVTFYVTDNIGECVFQGHIKANAGPDAVQ